MNLEEARARFVDQAVQRCRVTWCREGLAGPVAAARHLISGRSAVNGSIRSYERTLSFYVR